MAKTVLSVGNCSMDHGAIARMLAGYFDVEVLRSARLDDTLTALRSTHVDLVLVNRILDADGTEGMEVIREIKASLDQSGVPVMLVSNYPEHQATAIAAGGEPGFGKSELGDPQTREKLARFLD
jgi:DNA-binding NarL/FixJ family response regulator